MAVASSRLSGSIRTDCTPSGIAKSFTSRYCESDVARIMKSAQIGAAKTPPVSPTSRLSSKPIQITHRRLEVNPANHPSRDVPVFPAAGRVKPRARTPAAVPRFMTSFSKLSTRNATRGSRAWCVCGENFSSGVPSALTTVRINWGSARVPIVANVVYPAATSTGVIS